MQNMKSTAENGRIDLTANSMTLFLALISAHFRIPMPIRIGIIGIRLNTDKSMNGITVLLSMYKGPRSTNHSGIKTENQNTHNVNNWKIRVPCLYLTNIFE